MLYWLLTTSVHTIVYTMSDGITQVFSRVNLYFKQPNDDKEDDGILLSGVKL